MVIVQDLDKPGCAGAFWGEVQKQNISQCPKTNLPPAHNLFIAKSLLRPKFEEVIF